MGIRGNTTLIGAGILGIGLIFGFMYAFDLKTNEIAMTVAALPMEGHVTAVAMDPDGSIKSYYQGDNFFVVAGTNCIAFKVWTTNPGCVTATNVPTALAIATGAPAFTSTAVALVGEVGTRDFSDVTSTAGTATVPTKVTIRGIFTIPAGVNSLASGGLFDQIASPGGNLYDEFALPVTGITGGDILNLTLEIFLGNDIAGFTPP